MPRCNSHCDFFGGRKLHLLYIFVSSCPFIPPRRATCPLLCDRFRPPFCSMVFPVSLSKICDDSELYIQETIRLSQRGSGGCRRWLKLKIFGETSPTFRTSPARKSPRITFHSFLQEPTLVLLCLSLRACIIFVLLIIS